MTADVLTRSAAGLGSQAVPTVSEVVLNVLLFVPFGVLLHRAGRRRYPLAGLVALVCAAGLLLSLAVECLQLFVPRRHPTIVDVIANAGGALCGAAADRWWGSRRDRQGQWWRIRPAGAALAGVLATFTVVVLLTGGLAQRQTRLSNWDASFPLLVGNERTGDRPWRGRIFSLEMSDAAMGAELVRGFSLGAKSHLPGAPIARIEFAGPPPYRDAAGVVPALAWTKPPGHPEAGGVRLHGRPWLQTAGPATAMAQRLGDSNAFTIRLHCASDDLHQAGPARIVSNSVDYNQRNLTIAQQNQDLVVRIRTPYTGANGSRPDILVPGVFSDLTPRDILITYDGANATAAVAGSSRVYRVRLSPGAILARRFTSLDIEADEHHLVEWMFLGALLLPPAVLIAATVDGVRHRMAIGGAWVVIFALLLESTLVVVSGRTFSWATVVLTILAGMAVMALFASTRSEARMPDEG